MKVIYKGIGDKILEEMAQAKESGREIRQIILTRTEASELYEEMIKDGTIYSGETFAEFLESINPDLPEVRTYMGVVIIVER